MAALTGRGAVPAQRNGSPGEAQPNAAEPRVSRTWTTGGTHTPPTAPARRTRAPLTRTPAPLTRAWWNTPRLVRALAALCAAALLAFAAAAATVLGSARSGIDAIGHRAAPQAVRAADLYLALNDMDAQAANLLLLGADPDYASLRRQTLDTYEQRRTQATADLQDAAAASAADPAGRTAVRGALGELGRYEALVARAQLLEEQAHAPAGRPSAAALDAYRQATDLLRRQLLPAADQVLAANAATVDRTEAAQRGELAAGWWWILGTGLSAALALAALQRTLTVRFRRLVNPPLAAVTVLLALCTAGGLVAAGRASDHLAVAKSNAYDSVIALSRARAAAYDMNADESRYLTDPGRAVAYEQSFLDKTQDFARLDGATLADYDTRLAGAADRHRADRGAVPFGGQLGTELRNITFSGEQDAAERILTAFQQYQRDDRTMRELARQGRVKDAVTFNTGLAAGQSNADFAALTTALDAVLDINQSAFDREIAEADDDLGAGLADGGAAALAAALALTVLGVRPRLREYR